MAQTTVVDFALHTLGWKAFQDLAVAVAAEVLGRPVQVFLSTQDGGRDGAFVGTWPGAADTPDAKSTIQCKFTGKAGATLALGDVSGELGKVASLAARGLAHDYVLLTNAGVSGEREAEIAAKFEAAGARRARVLGREWLTLEIRDRPRLRMMVPRLYGLGDLSQIIDERAYLQARYILSTMGNDLATFVTTAAHRQSVEALHQHRFVLLLGDPASGKSTIGASLALGALDDGAIGTMRLSTGEAFERHWNPHEPSQFFWIDDAFGETQYQRARVDGWNSRLKLIRAAVKAGARVLMTSRNYIWNAAQRDLKLSEFPLLTNSQVIIDVQGLSDVERAQILYNHLRRGDQPSAWRQRLKPFLPAIATNRHFLPETARRLGSTFFTSKLCLQANEINAFVDEPLEFLKDVLRTLAEPDRAAIALIFLHGTAGVPSPIAQSEALETVCRLSGVGAAEVARAMETLQGGLTLLLESESGRRWTFKHPTIADAYATLVAGSPEMVELYVRGAKLEKLLSEVVCGSAQLAGASVHVPHSLYEALLDRMAAKGLMHEDVLRFAVHRGDSGFLARMVERDLSFRWMSWNEVDFVAKLHASGLLSEPIRLAAVESISELAVDFADAKPFRDKDVRALFTDAEFAELDARFETEIVERYGLRPDQWYEMFHPRSVELLRELKGAIETYTSTSPRSDDPEIKKLSAMSKAAIDAYIQSIEDDDEEPHDGQNPPVSSASRPPDQIASIFDDVDD
jgi:hypothetical protein